MNVESNVHKNEQSKRNMDSNNIFRNAYLGKAYKTRDGRKAIFYNHHNSHAREKANYVTMILENQESIYRWYYDATAADHQEHLDIVSEWHEEINEEELDRLAKEYFHSLSRDNGVMANFKAGYRKANSN